MKRIVIPLFCLVVSQMLFAQVPDTTVAGSVEIFLDGQGDLYIAVDRFEVADRFEGSAGQRLRDERGAVRTRPAEGTAAHIDGLADDLFIFSPSVDLPPELQLTRLEAATVSYYQGSLTVWSRTSSARRKLLHLSILDSVEPKLISDSTVVSLGGAGISYQGINGELTFEDIRRLIEAETLLPAKNASECDAGGCGASGCSIGCRGGCSVTCNSSYSACCDCGGPITLRSSKCYSADQMVCNEQ